MYFGQLKHALHLVVYGELLPDMWRYRTMLQSTTKHPGGVYLDLSFFRCASSPWALRCVTRRIRDLAHLAHHITWRQVSIISNIANIRSATIDVLYCLCESLRTRLATVILAAVLSS